MRPFAIRVFTQITNFIQGFLSSFSFEETVQNGCQVDLHGALSDCNSELDQRNQVIKISRKLIRDVSIRLGKKHQ